MNSAPVSVVIPTYNRRELVRDAIDSVLAQTLVPEQIIVVDDGSTDDTAATLRSLYAGRIVCVSRENGGISAAKNLGISLADRPFVAFLDDDDAWHPRKLELQMHCFREDPEIALLGARQFDWPAPRFPDVPGDPGGMLVRVTWEQLVVRTLIPFSSVVVRRPVFDTAGTFDPSFPTSEDRDFFLRVAEVAPVGMLDIPLSGYRDTPGSLCKNPRGREEAMLRILRRIDESGAWRGRWLLRRKAYSYLHYGCSDAQARAGNHLHAAARALKSLACYPLPYGSDARMRFDRPKRIAVNLLRAARLKRPDRVGAARPPLPTNALRELHRDAAEPTLSIPSPL